MTPAPFGGGLRRMPGRRKRLDHRFPVGEPMLHAGDFLCFFVALSAQQDHIAGAGIGHRLDDGTGAV